ncbi:MAG TPA: hypothetical protein PK299_10090 [Anaerolineales bacterium]|nr:hypothetical protein [Anaerolineales bacterium]
MKHTATPLLPGVYYHIYNRGNNREDLFIEKRNYRYFLALYSKHIEPIADTFAYCLLKNHFHCLVRIKSEVEVTPTAPHHPAVSPTAKPKPFRPHQNFANLFNAYAKAINRAYGRTGSLFEERFGRIAVTNSRYFQTLIQYIHHNPQKHGFVADFREWEWSSYATLCSTGETELKREDVLHFFGGLSHFRASHESGVNLPGLSDVLDEEFERETA